MKRIALFAAAALMLLGCNQKQETATTTQEPEGSVVYMTRDISPESLVKIYQALGVEANGRVAVKISTGEGSNPNYLKPELIKNLVQLVDGTIVECNTAYGGSRATFEKHWETIKAHGFLDIAKVDLMDEEGDMEIPVVDNSHIKSDIV